MRSISLSKSAELVKYPKVTEGKGRRRKWKVRRARRRPMKKFPRNLPHKQTNKTPKILSEKYQSSEINDEKK